jgi:hypothetical protein
MSKKISRTILILFIGALSLFILIQIVPPVKRTNPPVVAEPPWDTPGTRDLTKRACFSCHSNETVWPWYAHVAPISWFIVHDVQEGRSMFNFSEWSSGIIAPRTLTRVISKDEMPLPRYRLLHPEARLSQSEKEQLLNGLLATIK